MEGKGPNKYWITPPKLFEELDARFSFDFDPCPFPKPEWDGLLIEWGNSNFINPPYLSRDGGPISKWIQKGHIEHAKGKRCVFLLPLYDRALFSYVPDDPRFEFIGRVRYVHIETGDTGRRPPFDSFLYILD